MTFDVRWSALRGFARRAKPSGGDPGGWKRGVLSLPTRARGMGTPGLGWPDARELLSYRKQPEGNQKMADPDQEEAP